MEQTYSKVVGLVDQEVASFMAMATGVGLWYASGLIFSVLLGILMIRDGKMEEVRIKDFEGLLGWALLGPLIGLILIGILFLKATNGIRNSYSESRHTVLWRSKTSKTKAVLYGSKDDDDA